MLSHLRTALVAVGFAALASTVAAPPAIANAAAVAADASVVVDTEEVLQSNWLGVGVQWDPADDQVPTYSEAQWQLITSRVDYLQTRFARVMIGMTDYVTGVDASGNFTYDFNSGRMQRLYRILDYAQAHSVTVMLGEWNKPDSATSYHDPRWMRAIADCLNELRNHRGYTVIKYYNFVNEPNGSWTIPSDNWNQWYDGVTALYNTLNSRGYLNWVKIVGPDTAYADDWVNRAADTIPNVMGQYEYHVYTDTLDEITSGSIESKLRMRRDYINATDPDGRSKYLYLGEMGDKVGITDYSRDVQDRVYDYSYGVEMADIAIQMIRGGGAGTVPWDLDDSMHLNAQGEFKRWGYWNTFGGYTINGYSYPPSDTSIRPFYYPLSTLSRLFPQGAQTVYASASGLDGVRTAAAKISNAGNYDLSFAIVNQQSTTKTVHLRVPAARNQVTLREYLYSPDDRPTDGNGFPVVRQTLTNVDLNGGVVVTVPASSVVFFTTIGTATATPLAANGGWALTDEMANWTKVAAHTANWRFDASNPQYFRGDTTRLTRTTDTAESVTYRVDGASSFKIEETHFADVSNRLHVYASPGGGSWSLVSLKSDVAASASGNWYTQFFHPTGSLPDGTNYVRVELRGDPNIWTPQLDRIKILTSNLALGRPAYASSVEPGTSLVASKAVDGKTGTRWGSAWSDPQWFYVDLGSAQQVSRVVLLWEAAYARKFQIQVSTDNDRWTTVYDQENGTGGTQTATFSPVTARYVKMFGWERGTPYGYSLWEFEVYDS